MSIQHAHRCCLLDAIRRWGEIIIHTTHTHTHIHTRSRSLTHTCTTHSLTHTLSITHNEFTKIEGRLYPLHNSYRSCLLNAIWQWDKITIHAFIHTHTHTCSLSLTRTHPLSLTHSGITKMDRESFMSVQHTHTHNLRHGHNWAKRWDIHAHTHTYTHTQTHTLTHDLSPSHTHTLAFSLSYTHTRTHCQSSINSHTHTYHRARSPRVYSRRLNPQIWICGYDYYGVATVSRLLKIIGLFGRISSLS